MKAMKRRLAILLCAAMMFSICTVSASAWGVSGNWGTSAKNFAPVGEMEINWDADAGSKITLDGDLSEWVANGYNVYRITPRNMVSWVGSVDPDWKMECFFVADAERLYVAFYITDDKACVGDNPRGYNGDAFQIALDWNRNVGYALEQDEYAVATPQDIFYCFSMMEDTNELTFMRQNSEGRDGLVYDGNTEEAGDEYDEEWPEFAKDNEWVGMAGAAAKTADGWCAEFSVTWQRLASDAYYKLWDGDLWQDAAIGPDQDLEIGCSFYYLNRDEDKGGVTWAAGTMKGNTDESGKPLVTWTSTDDGVTLVLKYHEGMSFNNSDIQILAEGEHQSERETTTEPEDWSWYDPSWDEPATEPGTDPVTAPETEPATEPENEGRVECIGSANDITFSGWASLGKKRIAAYGYAFDGDWSNAIWSEDFVKEADSAVIEAAGSRYATRYEITVDASRIPATGLRMLNLLVRATDGSVYELASWDTVALKLSSGVGGEIDRTDATNRSDSDSMTADPAETDEDKFDRNDNNKRNNDDDDEYDEDIFQFDFEGCSSTIGAGAAALVLSAMAAAVALKKKH